MKVINRYWFTGGAGNNTIDVIGLVVIQNPTGEKKAYIKTVRGLNEKNDEQDVIENGAPVMLNDIERIHQDLGGQ